LFFCFGFDYGFLFDFFWLLSQQKPNKSLKKPKKLDLFGLKAKIKAK